MGKKAILKYAILGIACLILLPIAPLILGSFIAHKLFKNSPTKKRGILLATLTIIISLILTGVVISKIPTSNKETSKVEGEQTSQVEPTNTPIPSPPSTPNPDLIKVVRVIDGDTIEIEGGKKVRLISVDTPETVDPRTSVQCYGKAASDFTKSQLEGKEVRLEKDISETDKYGRLLRYVWFGDGFFNETLVREGYAQVVSYPPDIKYLDRLREAEKKAREENKGLWSACQTTATSTPVPTTTSVSGSSTGSQTCKYSCTSPDRDCSDFSSHSEAQTFFNCCGFDKYNDPMKLDSVGTGDGVACESLP